MSQEYNSGFCKYCNEQVKTQRESPNHILHFLITILTCGFWVVIWFLLCLQFGGWNCSNCGQKIDGLGIDGVSCALITFASLLIGVMICFGIGVLIICILL